MDMGGLVPAGVGKQRGCPWCSPGGTGSNLLAGMTPTFTWVRITYYFRPLCAKWLRWGGENGLRYLRVLGQRLKMSMVIALNLVMGEGPLRLPAKISRRWLQLAK